MPMDLAAAHAMILEERRARLAADLKVAQAKAEASETEALVEHLKLQILKLRRQIYGVSSERTARLSCANQRFSLGIVLGAATFAPDLMDATCLAEFLSMRQMFVF
ncbi:hypothetical protein [Asticcacaulis benevestitus]|uniref:Transposase TnpC homeodomain domain-containing protein n=1 Tax=Asticcacaulis benevestitus DSM 16100 = ATCC BAA-896 TaxID=1121022 RepID=V4P5U1_9CAUL|nr:hypothetical protein [Asticcacaulis benevestitus]ESQ82499.1 hypothetical protein ABENE_21015 [Asticcacaulis benevestitus DSM 16100 = ATCC BAA-896]